MTFDSRYALAALVGSKDSGVKAKNIGDIACETTNASSINAQPWSRLELENNIYGAKRPKDWSKFDSFLVKKFGTTVKRHKATCFKPEERLIGRYSSGTIQSLLKRSKLSYQEYDLLQGATEISENCDLRNTTLNILPSSLKKIGGNLTISTNSSLKDLSALQTIGKLTVVAKNQADVNPLLKELGIMSKDGAVLPVIKDGIHFIMKNYL